MRIFKYELIEIEPAAAVTVSVSKGAKLLSIAAQFGRLNAWFLIDETQTETESRSFKIFGTGHFVKDHGPFITTVLLAEGNLVLHIFEAPPTPMEQGA